MKASILLGSLLLVSVFVQAQTYSSSCTPSGNMVDIYRNDAYRLATKRVNDINSTWKDSVAIPQIFIDSIAKGLYAIENMHNSAIRDTIMTLFGYQNFANYSYQADSSHMHNAGNNWNYAYRLKYISVTVLNSTSWAADWAGGNFSNTTNDSINSLVNRYSLNVIPAQLQIYPDKKIYGIYAPAALNIPALKNQFSLIYGVVYSDMQNYFGGGNSMTAEINNGDVTLTYSLGCGDCPSGCTYGRTWKFKVNTSTDCSVEYLSANYWGIITVIPGLFSLSDCMGPVVPVLLTSIKVSQKNDYQLVEWQMAQEDNVASYVIQRSTDASNYMSIGQINLTQTSTGTVNYSWNDRDMISGKNFYRIKIIDRSGAIKYSPVAVLDVKLKTTIRVFPTLVTNNNVHIQFGKVEKGIYYIELLNTAGQKLFSTQADISTEIFDKQVQIPVTFSPGVYILSVHGMAIRQNQLIVISK